MTAGLLAAVTQIIIGHPFDTIKTIKQATNKNYKTIIFEEMSKKRRFSKLLYWL